MSRRANQGDRRGEAAQRAASAGLRGLETAIAAASVGHEREFAACWAQEALLRDLPVGEVAGACQPWEQLRQERHPLAWLPLVLTDAEALVQDVLPMITRGGSGYSAPEQPVRRSRAIAIPGLSVVEVAVSPERSAEIRAAVAGWEAESGGSVELREFTVTPRLVALDASVVAALELSCLRGAAEIASESIGVAPAFRSLFCAATNGGAHGGGLGGAYGRLAAWRSLGALAGVAPSASAEVALEIARKCQWLSFFAPGWFQDVAWDLGLAALRPDGVSIAVLAATDTD